MRQISDPRRSADSHSNGVPIGGAKCSPKNLAGARRDIPPGALSSRQPAYKLGSGWLADTVRKRDGHSSGTPVTRRLKQPTRTAGSGPIPKRARASFAPSLFGLAPGGVCRAADVAAGAVRSYRTVSPLPRLLRYAPRRSVLCGTVPGLAPAGRYPAPFVHGARTFLPGNLSVSPKRPSGRLTGKGMGALAAAVKRPKVKTPPAWRDGRGPRCFWRGRAWPEAPAKFRASTDRPRRRCAPAGNGAGRPSPRRASPYRIRR